MTFCIIHDHVVAVAEHIDQAHDALIAEVEEDGVFFLFEVCQFSFKLLMQLAVSTHHSGAHRIGESPFGGSLCICPAYFGMAGDQGKLKEIAALRPRFNFRLLVDDAHGFGTLGQTGAGAGEAQGVQDEIDLYFSTFAKSMASIGAFVAGPKKILDYVRYNIRSQIFAKALPMPLVVGNLKRLELLRTQPQLKQRLWDVAIKLQKGLKAKGFDIGKTDSVVTPIYMKGGVEEATAMVMDLREHYHIFCSIVVYPVIPKGHIIYRLIPTAVHTDEEIRLTLEAFDDTKRKLDAGAYQVEAIPEMAGH